MSERQAPMDGDSSSHPPVLELRSRVPATAHGRPLLAYLGERFPYHDEAAWRAELGAGRLWLDGRVAAATSVLRRGAVLVYRKPHAEPPVADDLRILHADDDLVVVDKPAHLPMHADGPFVRNTLIHLLRERHGFPTATLVHRLDRETSGLVLVARTAAARTALAAQFQSGSVHKHYAAVVEGQLADCVCRQPIGGSAASAIALRRSAAADATAPQPASTTFTVLQRGPRRTLVRCEPHTGRTHQIRVHLEHVGHRITGDRLYGHPDAHYLEFVARVKAGADPRTLGTPARQLLHAAAIACRHPRTEEPVRFESAPPAEFAAWLARGD